MRILLLEDEQSIRGFVRINLKRSGMDAVEPAAGEEAPEPARREGPFPITPAGRDAAEYPRQHPADPAKARKQSFRAPLLGDARREEA